MGDTERREGDWDCPDCGAVVFASKDSCFKCDRASGKTRREGDWDCPDCGAIVFASRETCFKCDRANGKGAGGRGKGPRPRQEGDWDCPDCGMLVFASRETCFKCDRANGVGGKGPRPRQEGDWDCPSCGMLVFAGRLACFKCGAGGGTAAAAGGGGGKGAAAAATPAVAIKSLAKVSKDFRKAWVAYCKLYGEGVNNPADHEEDFITGFADYTAGVLSEAMDPKPKKRAADGAGGDGEAPAKKKVTIKKAVAEAIQRLNKAGGLLAPIRLGAVAIPLAKLDEVSALKALNTLEEQQGEVEDPNEFLKTQVTCLLEGGDGAQEAAAAEEDEAYPW